MQLYFTNHSLHSYLLSVSHSIGLLPKTICLYLSSCSHNLQSITCFFEIQFFVLRHAIAVFSSAIGLHSPSYVEWTNSHAYGHSLVVILIDSHTLPLIFLGLLRFICLLFQRSWPLLVITQDNTLTFIIFQYQSYFHSKRLNQLLTMPSTSHLTRFLWHPWVCITRLFLLHSPL